MTKWSESGKWQPAMDEIEILRQKFFEHFATWTRLKLQEMTGSRIVYISYMTLCGSASSSMVSAMVTLAVSLGCSNTGPSLSVMLGNTIMHENVLKFL
jgi:hypothetical protein